MANEIFENIWKIMKENKFQYIDPINNDLICNICNRLMIKACNVPCGCRYCFECIINYLNSKEKFCPGKNKFCQMKTINDEKDVAIDYATNVRILEVRVKCPIKNCEFTDELILIENHMRTCDKNPTSCPYYEIGCKNDEVMIDEIKDHLCTEIFCHTKLLLDFINNLRNEMELMKNEIVELKSENKYLKEELEIIKIDCKNNQMKNEELNEEIVVVKNENRSMMNKLENIEKSQNEMELIKNEIVELKSENKHLKEEIKIIKIDCKNNQMKNEEIIVVKNENRSRMNRSENIEKSRVIFDINEMVEIMKRTSEQQTKEIDEMKEKFNKIDLDLIKKLNINNYDEKINNLQMKIMKMETVTEIINNFTKFEWKIENLSKQTDTCSESFYSHKNGYKMCLSVEISWIGLVRFYFHLMRGEFDNYLLWPFEHCVTIDIINQIDGTIYKSKSIKHDDRPNEKGWIKPTTERNEGIYFITIKKSEEIIRNDQLLIKCKINI